MQIDFHYYASFVLAYLAGFESNDAKTIATSSQFVDDMAKHMHVDFEDGGSIVARATAHHGENIENLDRDDQRQIWVPFHFLPGARADGPFTTRLVCRMDSDVAQEMMEEALGKVSKDVGLYRLGVATHVYQDTFSHYGFSGVSSRRNKIDNTSLIFKTSTSNAIMLKQKALGFRNKYKSAKFIENIKSYAVETISGGLGHGAVITYPDLPYLHWEFRFEDPSNRVKLVPHDEKRANPSTFLESCKKLYAYYVKAADNLGVADAGKISFDQFEEVIVKIISVEGDKEARCRAWSEAAGSGKLGQASFEIPVYEGQEWLEELENFRSSPDSIKALEHESFLYLRAASAHRNYVLRELLPAHGLVVA